MTSGPSPAGTSLRWLQVLQVLLILFLVATSVGGALILGTLAVQLATGYSMPISFQIIRTIGEPAALPTGHQLTGLSEILINDPTLAQTALRLAGFAVPVAIAILVTVALLRTVRSSIARNPFSDDNLRRVRMIGLVLLFGGLAETLVTMVTQWMIARISLGEAAGSPMITGLPTVALAGVAVLAIAEVMRQGAAMRAELDQVV